MRDNFSEIVSLVKAEETATNGVLNTTETSRTVYCAAYSHIRTAKNEGSAHDFTYETKIKLADSRDYQGENYADYNSKRYEITRTYQDGDMIELTLTGGRDIDANS